MVENDTVCHCFHYSRADIQSDYIRHGYSNILERIQAEKKFGNCRCAEKNPKGR